MRIHVFVVPMDSGARSWRMGAGPEALLAAGVATGVQAQGLDVSVDTFEPSARGEVASAFETARWIATRVASARSEGAFPIVLAGNCISSVGSFAGLRSRSRRVPGVCWFDAHADFNTPETTPSGFLDGMALAVLAGRCWTGLAKSVQDFRPVPEGQVLLLGARDLDPEERKSLNASEVRQIDAREKPESASKKIAALRASVGEVYLHVDLDALDESEGRVNQYSSSGGFTKERLLDLVREIAASFHVGALALTAYDPSCDPAARIPPIARALVDIVASSHST